MGSRNVLLIAFAFVLYVGASVLAQGPTYGVGRTPTAAEIRALDISISPEGDELPLGRGTVKEGAGLFEEKGCSVCHGDKGLGGMAPQLQSTKGQDVPIWK